VGPHDGCTPYDPNDLRFIAMHEAGHAVAAIALYLPLRSVDLVPRKMSGGGDSQGLSSLADLDPRTIRGKGEEAVMPHLVHSMAGAIAEAKVNPHVHGSGCDAWDVQHQRRLATLAFWNVTTPEGQEQIEDRVNALLESAREEAVRLVEERWAAIEQVASLLIRKRRLGAAEVARIVHRVGRLA
jgi:ATP-dependent Zn protease